MNFCHIQYFHLRPFYFVLYLLFSAWDFVIWLISGIYKCWDCPAGPSLVAVQSSCYVPVKCWDSRSCQIYSTQTSFAIIHNYSTKFMAKVRIPVIECNCITPSCILITLPQEEMANIQNILLFNICWKLEYSKFSYGIFWISQFFWIVWFSKYSTQNTLNILIFNKYST